MSNILGVPTAAELKQEFAPVIEQQVTKITADLLSELGVTADHTLGQSLSEILGNALKGRTITITIS